MSTTTQPPMANSTAKQVDMPDPTEDDMWEEEVSCAQRVLLVMRDIGNVPKTDYNEAQQFHYRSVERVVAATRDAMVKHGLLCMPTRVTVNAENYETTTAAGKPRVARRASLKVTYTFMSADDVTDAIETEIVSEALDYGGDKAVSQALTAAHKAILLQSFQVGDSGTDQDTGTGEVEMADAETVELIVQRASTLPVEAKPILNFLWAKCRWGSIAQREVPAYAVDDVMEAIRRLEEAFVTVA